MYEHKRMKLVPIRVYARRQVLHTAVGIGFVLAGLAIGSVGYELCEHRGWIDSTYSAAMILTGMGPAHENCSDTTKVFASVYAVFSGILFLTSASIIIAPALHRFLHKLHMDEDEARS